jgi:hypothetical protein
MRRWRYAITGIVMGALGCTELETTSPEPTDVLETFKRDTAAAIASALADDGTRERLVAELRRDGAVPLSAHPELVTSTVSLAGRGAVPEIWLRDPDGGAASTSDLVVAYSPAGDESTWTAIPAFALDGRRVTLDATTAPSVAVIVVETHGRLAMREGIAEANLALQQAGLQRTREIAQAAATGKWTIRLDRIVLRDDMEPWISGAAEVYAIASGVVGDNDPELRIVELPYLDHDGTTYLPNQIIVDWSQYGYQAVNVQLFEHDDSTSYQELVIALVSAVGAIGDLAGYPAVHAVAEIANRILAAMPASWFSNDDDYVDSFYTLEKNRSYPGHGGVSRNATVTLSPYYLAPN